MTVKNVKIIPLVYGNEIRQDPDGMISIHSTLGDGRRYYLNLLYLYDYEDPSYARLRMSQNLTAIEIAKDLGEFLHAFIIAAEKKNQELDKRATEYEQTQKGKK